jgi:hypothetical protein
MMKWFRNLPLGRRLCVVAVVVLLSFATARRLAHWERRTTADRELDASFEKYPQLKRQAVARFAGQVTIDGRSPADPSGRSVLFVVLHQKRQDRADQELTPRYHTRCDSTGHFTFSTYFKEDGVAVGSYVVTFAQLRRGASRGRGAFGPPDGLKNLYNDPDKNAQCPEFVIDVKIPGETDYRFDLAVAGLDPVDTPRPHALTSVGTW